MSEWRPEAAPPVLTDRWRFLGALNDPQFRVFWSGAFVSNIGSWMQTVAQGWLVLQLTNSAFMLGLVGFAGTLPMLVLLLVGGVFADRLDRRRLLIWTQLGMTLFAGALAVLTWTGAVRIWHILVLSLLSGSAIALAAPAYQAFVHDLVGRSRLQNAIALNSAQFNLSRVVGPSLAGLVLGALGLAGCFGLNSVSYLAAIAALLWIRTASRRNPSPERVWQSLVDGVGYVRERRRIQAILILVALISVLAMPYATLLPIIARDRLGLDAAGLGYLYAVGGLGAVAGALSLTLGRVLPHRGVWLLGSGVATGVAVLVLGLASTPVVAGAGLVGIGFAATSAIALGNTLLQELVDDGMRGRVLSMFGLAFMGTFPIANLLAGSLASVLTASGTMALTGALLTASVTAIAVFRPRLRGIE